MSHTFHIPVLGLGFSVDTPLKVARYGISSVMSIVDDELIERMREYHAGQNNRPYTLIKKGDDDHRAKRITAYLNLVDELISEQFEVLKQQQFGTGSDLDRYFQLLPESSQLRQGYDLMMEYPDGERRRLFQAILKKNMVKGSADVNIMAKVDKMNFTEDGQYTGDENTDALAALRGFAKSTLCSAVTLSAGMNPRLYSYLEAFPCFFPDENGEFQKKVILKVSDFRSAFIQAKFLAKKGIWVSEFRVESGLNCGGHAFATEGFLLGPILEEFKTRRVEMQEELYRLFESALLQKGMLATKIPVQRITVQGGIGTVEENEFLQRYYNLDGTGWGSPFLLVPEATNVDDDTLAQLSAATESDYYLSNASPLGILFNNFKQATIEQQRQMRIEFNRPGSPCTKKFLCSNTEFTEQPICTASRQYQNLKLKQIEGQHLAPEARQNAVDAVTEKICLCEGLCSSAYLKYNITKPRENTAVAVCPGPNLAYFRSVFSLDDMVAHIYGKIDLLKNATRPHVFLKELELYVDYLQKDIQQNLAELSAKKKVQLGKFKEQLLNGISYYKTLYSDVLTLPAAAMEQLRAFESRLEGVLLPELQKV